MTRPRFVWAPVVPVASMFTASYLCLFVAWLVPDWGGVLAIAWIAAAVITFVVSFFWQRNDYRKRYGTGPRSATAGAPGRW